MQITDEQFIRAMEQAVKEKGGGHVALATYSQSGVPQCIVGYALWCIDKKACPLNNQHMADTLLPVYGISNKVARAAYAAQHLNDAEYNWGIVLDGFKFALTQPEDLPRHELVYRVRMHAERSRRKEVAPTRKPQNIVWAPQTMTKITVNFDALVKQMDAMTVAIKKQDHDLVA